MGLNQSTVGMWKNNSLINLHLLTGQIGKPGAGPFSLTGQPNAMGGREVGLLAQSAARLSLRRGRRHRAEVEAFWDAAAGDDLAAAGTDGRRDVSGPGDRASSRRSGSRRPIPRSACPTCIRSAARLARAELVVVQDAYHPTETTRAGRRPAAGGPVVARRTWTSTDSERLVCFSPSCSNRPGRGPARLGDPGQLRRGDGLRGVRLQGRGARSGTSSSRLTTGRPCDMAGHDGRSAAAERHLQWPCPSVDHPGTERRYLDRKFPTPDGRARFLARPHQPPRETPDHEFPLVLTTGRHLCPLAHPDPHRQVTQAGPARAVRRSSRSTPTTRPSSAWPQGSGRTEQPSWH